MIDRYQTKYLLAVLFKKLNYKDNFAQEVIEFERPDATQKITEEARIVFPLISTLVVISLNNVGLNKVKHKLKYAQWFPLTKSKHILLQITNVQRNKLMIL